jgi:hypothetical protein
MICCAELDAQASQELQQQQQRREALELALHSQQQQQQGWAAGAGSAMSAGSAAGGGIRLYPLSDALLPGGVAAAGYWPQQQQQHLQQQQMHELTLAGPHIVQLQQQRLQHTVSAAGSDAEHSVPRPPSSSTEFSFVQRSDHGDGGTTTAAAAGAAPGVHTGAASSMSSSSPQQHREQQQQADALAVGVTSGAVMTEVQEIAAAAAGAAQAVAALCSIAGSYQQHQQQQLSGEFSTSAAQPAVSYTAEDSIPGQAPAAAAAADVQNAPPSGYAADVLQQNQPAENDAAAVEVQLYTTHAEATVRSQPSDAAAGKLSASSNSAEVLEAAAAAAAAGLEGEGVRLSSGSIGASGSRSVDRYASWAAGGYEEEEGSEDEGGEGGELLQDYAVAAGAAVTAQYYSQQQQQQNEEAEEEGDFEEMEEAGHILGPAAAAERVSQPGTLSSPGWLGDPEQLHAQQYDADDAGSETGQGGGVALGGASRWVQEPLSPGSSNGSVF